MENLVIKGNSKVPGRRNRNSKGKMEMNQNLHKESLALSAMNTNISRKSVPII